MDNIWQRGVIKYLQNSLGRKDIQRRRHTRFIRSGLMNLGGKESLNDASSFGCLANVNEKNIDRFHDIAMDDD